MDDDRQKEFEKMMKQQFFGSSNAASAVILYNESKENAPEIVKFNNEEDDLKYRYITDKIVEEIGMAHNLPVALLGLMVPGKLGSATEIPTYEMIYNKYVVQPLKDELTTTYEALKSKLIV